MDFSIKQYSILPTEESHLDQEDTMQGINKTPVTVILSSFAQTVHSEQDVVGKGLVSLRGVVSRKNTHFCLQ